MAVARKLAAILHSMRRDGTVYVGDPSASGTEASALAAAKARGLLGAHA